MAAQRTIESFKLQPCETLTPHEENSEEFTVTTRIEQPVLSHISDPTRLKSLETTIAWVQAGQPRALTFFTYLHCESD